MAGTLFRLLVILLGLSHLFCLNAVPITRIESLLHQPQLVKQDTRRMVATEKSSQAQIIDGRMAVELNDYPGSGANNRHTPRPQLGRGCVDG